MTEERLHPGDGGEGKMEGERGRGREQSRW